MRIEPSGVVMIGECEIQTPFCTALTPAPITAVWASPGRRQIDVCRPCLEEMVRLGEWENPGAKIPRRYDMAVYDQADRLQLVVEVKKRPYEIATEIEQWATRIRRNLIVHAGIPSSIYFLLAIYPAPFYLWGKEEAPEAPPRHCFDAETEVVGSHGSLTATDHREQEDAIYSWLKTLMSAPAGSENVTEAHSWLYESGLYRAIHGGTVVRQTGQSQLREPQAA